jgi:predicted DNA-binding protein
MASDRLSVRISGEQKAELQSVIEATGKPEAEVVREALAEYCLKHASLPTAYDLAEEAGVIGCVKGGPADRSTDRRHFEGFGRD